MVRAAELFGAALRFGDDCCSMMATNVVKGSKLTVFTARDDDGLTCQFGGEKMTRFAHLVRAPHDLPGRAEDAGALELRDTGVEIPGCGNGPRPLKGVGGVV